LGIVPNTHLTPHIQQQMKITKAVLPIAGRGTRFLPVTKAVPKELLPIVDKPVLQYLIEEAVESGIEEIIFVISEDKRLIMDYLSSDKALEAFLIKKGKMEALKKVQALSTLAHYHFVYQKEPNGDGDAILSAESLVGDEPFLVLFGDDIVKHAIPAGKQLMDQFTGKSMIAVERVSMEMISQYGVVSPGETRGRLHEVVGLTEKPTPKEAPSDLGIIGKYICSPAIFKALKSTPSGKDGELRLIDAFIELAQSETIWAYEIEGQRFDTGRPEGLIAANNAFLKTNS